MPPNVSSKAPKHDQCSRHEGMSGGLDRSVPPRKRRRVNTKDSPVISPTHLLPSPYASSAPYRASASGTDCISSSDSEHSARASSVQPGASESVDTQGPTDKTGLTVQVSEELQRHYGNQVCFGMLSFSSKGRATQVPKQIINVELEGRKAFSCSGSKDLIGEIDPFAAGVLAVLKGQSDIELQLFVESQNYVQRDATPHNHTLYTIIYGNPTRSEDVSEYLDQCELHLQDPKHYDRNVPYQNPQALLIQGLVITQESSTMDDHQGLDVFSNPVDLLAELEDGDQLPLTETPLALRTQLHHHQKQALTFALQREKGWALKGPHPDLWRVETSLDGDVRYVNTITEETTCYRPPEFRGGLLADQMGLGKTLSMIALIASDKDGPLQPNRLDSFNNGTTLLVVRAALIRTWVDQLQLHIHPGQLTWTLHHGKSRIQHLSELSSTNIVITTYRTLMAVWKSHAKRPQILFNTHWRRIILDEAHDIRVSGCITAKAVCDLNADSRWAITGTPVQNDISDLASLFKFLRVYPYNDENLFCKLADQLCNASAEGVEKFKTLIKYVMLRRSIERIVLPERRDLIQRLEFTPDELAVYNRTKMNIERSSDDAVALSMNGGSHLNVLSWIHKLLMVCNLGTLADASEAFELDNVAAGHQDWTSLAAQSSFNSLVTAGSAICNGCSTDLGSFSTEVADSDAESDGRPRLSKCLQLTCALCLGKTDIGPSCDHQPPCPTAVVSTLSSSIHKAEDPPIGLTSAHELKDATPTKIRALVQDLRKHSGEEKSIVFSFWTNMLDHITAALDRENIRNVRIDGGISREKREKALKSFRENDHIRVALLTISCGAVGLDLTAASRAYLMEPHWNPSVEQQALARIHRMGQTRPVTTIRYIMRGSFEEKHVLVIQGRKQRLTDILLSQKKTQSSKSHSERIELFKDCL